MNSHFQHTGQPRADHTRRLDILARADVTVLKAFAEDIIGTLGQIEVIQSRTGLVMLPLRDTVQATDFHLGEVLVAEAHIRLHTNGAEGYGMIVGRDLERAMAMAIVDAATSIEVLTNKINELIECQALEIAAADIERLREIESTRVDMETF